MKLAALRAASGDPMALASLLWKPLAGIGLVLLLYVWAHHRGFEDAREKLSGQLQTATIQRAQALADLKTAEGANTTLKASIAKLKVENAHWASEADRLADEGLAAVQAEERRAAKAEAEAKQWATKYANETGKPKCAAALAALPLACPNLKDF